ncbi:MAG: PAS domain S-box protein [Raineya sp.]
MTEHFYSSLINYTRLVNEVLDTIHEGFFVLNYQGEILKTNKSFQEFIGIGEEKTFGTNFKDTLASFPLVALDMLKNAIEHKITQENDFFWDEKNKWFRFSIYPFEEGLIGIFSDITEKKIQEEKIRKS